jgi:hypothetical protein
MEAPAPASPDSLPPIGDLIADEPFWRYRSAPRLGRELRTCACGLPRRLSQAACPLSLRLAPRLRSRSLLRISGPHSSAAHWPSVVLIEHYLAPETEEGRRPSTWSASAPTAVCTDSVSDRPRRKPRHAELELGMAVHGYQIVSEPSAWFDQCPDGSD